MSRDERFFQLLELAKEGNEEALHDLFLEYDFTFHVPTQNPDPD